MKRDQVADVPSPVGALTLRLVAGLAFLAGGLLLAALVAVASLPTAEGRLGGAGLAIPGTRHLIDPAIVPLLAWSAGLCAALGCLALALGRTRLPLRWKPAAAEGPAIRRRALSSRPLLILAGGLLVLAAVLLRR